MGRKFNSIPIQFNDFISDYSIEHFFKKNVHYLQHSKLKLQNTICPAHIKFALTVKKQGITNNG